MGTTIYEGISRETREHLKALVTLSQFTRKAILDACRNPRTQQSPTPREVPSDHR